jgi:hypothetical protein
LLECGELDGGGGEVNEVVARISRPELSEMAAFLCFIPTAWPWICFGFRKRNERGWRGTYRRGVLG